MGIKVLFKNTLNSFKKKKIQLLAIGVIIALSSFLYTTMFYALDGLRRPFEDFVSEAVQEDFSIDVVNNLTKGDINSLIKKDINNLSIDEINSLNEKYKKDISNILTYGLTDIKKENKDLFNEIIKTRIEKFEKEYKDFEIELRQYKEVNFSENSKSNKATFVKDSDKINISFIEEGNKPISEDEIAINRIYAKKNNLEIGDKLSIKEKEYTISGYVLFPDITFPTNGKDFIIDNSKKTLALVTDKEYESIKGKENIYFSGIIKGKNLESSKNQNFIESSKKIIDNFDEEVVKNVKDKSTLDFVTDITITKNQMRSGAIYEELKSGQAVAVGISVIISLIAVMIVLILVYKIVRNEKTQIGLLKSIGYSKREILAPYIIFLTVVSLPMLILGYFAGLLAAAPMKNFYLDFYLIPDDSIKTNLLVLLVAVVVPLLVILGLSYILIMKMLSKSAIDLLSASDNKNVSKLNKVVNKIMKNSSPQTKFKYSFIFNNTSKFAVFFIGIVFSSMLIIMSFMMVGFFDKMTVDYYKSVDYVYEGYIDLTKELPKVRAGEEKFIRLENGIYDGKNVTIKGIELDNKLHKIFNKKNKDITDKLKDGVIVNRSFSIINDVEIGDMVEVTINGEDRERNVVKISKDYGNPTIYWSIDDLSNIVSKGGFIPGFEDGTFFNGVYSKDMLLEDDYLAVANKEDIIDQSKLMQSFIKIAIYLMIASAIFIATIVLYVLTTLTIEDNYYSISLLKVMGYDKKEVNSMMLRSYLIYAVISYLISVVATVIGFDYMVKFFGEKFGMVMPFEFAIWHSFIGIVIILAIFKLGTYAAKKRIEKVSLQEVLKAYRE